MHAQNLANGKFWKIELHVYCSYVGPDFDNILVITGKAQFLSVIWFKQVELLIAMCKINATDFDIAARISLKIYHIE